MGLMLLLEPGIVMLKVEVVVLPVVDSNDPDDGE